MQSKEERPKVITNQVVYIVHYAVSKGCIYKAKVHTVYEDGSIKLWNFGDRFFREYYTDEALALERANQRLATYINETEIKLNKIRAKRFTAANIKEIANER